MSISQLKEKFNCDILICAAESPDSVSIPGGDYEIHDGDILSVMAPPKNTASFF